MSGTLTLRRRFNVRKCRQGRKAIFTGSPEELSQVDCVPRVARLMALAIRFDRLIHDGTVTDQAEIARLGHVSRARLTQIMNLLNLAPDLQEVVLHLRPVSQGRGTISERNLRPIAATPNWQDQRRAWTTNHRSIDSAH